LRSKQILRNTGIRFELLKTETTQTKQTKSHEASWEEADEFESQAPDKNKGFIITNKVGRTTAL
jgi:hypothetical protein